VANRSRLRRRGAWRADGSPPCDAAVTNAGRRDVIITPVIRRAILGVSAAAVLATVVLLVMGIGESTPGDDFGLGGVGGLSFLVAAVGFGAAGALILAREPGHRVGWAFVVIAVSIGAGDLAYQYADQSYFGDAPAAGAAAAAWLQNITLPPSFGLLAIAVLLFPSGRSASRRWRWGLLPPAAGVALVVVGYALRPGSLDPPFANVANPLGIPGAFDVFETVAGIGWMLMAAGAGIAALSIVLRLRRSQGVERQQLRWIALAGAFVGATIVADALTFFLDINGAAPFRLVLVGISFTAIPIATGIAILRYRLYDIDVVINRALVYAALTGLLAVTYLASVLLLGLFLPASSDLAVALSTLAVAALFRPVRARVQHAVDRRFFRGRYDAELTLTAFTAGLRDEVELARVADGLVGAVGDTLQPAHVSLWLRP
jgi:hypothetical protein